MHQPGRHFLQIPGPTNTPLPVLAAIAKPTIDHRGPEFGELGREVLAGLRTVFKTTKPVIIYPASGTGAWEAALVNTLSPGDKVLMFETGLVLDLWKKMADRLGIEAEFIKGDWRSGVDAEAIESGCRRTRRTRSRPSPSSTTRPRPEWHPTSRRFAGRSTRPTTPPCSSSTRSRRSARSTTGTRSGASTSRSGARRRD